MAGPWRGELRASASRRVTENNVGTCQGERGSGQVDRPQRPGGAAGLAGRRLRGRFGESLSPAGGISKIAVTKYAQEPPIKPYEPPARRLLIWHKPQRARWPLRRLACAHHSAEVVGLPYPGRIKPGAGRYCPTSRNPSRPAAARLAPPGAESTPKTRQHDMPRRLPNREHNRLEPSPRLPTQAQLTGHPHGGVADHEAVTCARTRGRADYRKLR